MSVWAGDRSWLVEGAEVVAYNPGRGAPSVGPVLTVEKVGKREVRLSDGSRWITSRLERVGTSRDIWNIHSTLLPADDPEVKAGRIFQRRAIAYGHLYAAAEQADRKRDVDSLVTLRKRLDEAERLTRMEAGR